MLARETLAELAAALAAEGQDVAEVKLFDLVAETRDKLRPFLVTETFKTGTVPATYLAVDIILQEALARAAAPSLHKEGLPANDDVILHAKRVEGHWYVDVDKRLAHSALANAATLESALQQGIEMALENRQFRLNRAEENLDLSSDKPAGHKEGAGGERPELAQEYGQDHPWTQFDEWHKDFHENAAGGPIAWPCVAPLRCFWRWTRKTGITLNQSGIVAPLPLQRTLPDEQFKGAVVEAIERAHGNEVTISKEMFNNLCRFACANKHGEMPTHKEACLLSQIFNRYAKGVQDGERERINDFLARVISYTNSAASPAGRAEQVSGATSPAKDGDAQ